MNIVAYTFINFFFLQTLLLKFLNEARITLMPGAIVICCLKIPLKVPFRFYIYVGKWFFMIGKSFFKSSFTTTLVIFFAITKFI